VDYRRSGAARPRDFPRFRDATLTRVSRTSCDAEEHGHLGATGDWLCFHLEFEHEGDPDVPCLDASCPWRRIQFYEAALSRAGIDPKAALEAEMASYFRSFIKR